MFEKFLSGRGDGSIEGFQDTKIPLELPSLTFKTTDSRRRTYNKTRFNVLPVKAARFVFSCCHIRAPFDTHLHLNWSSK